MAVIAAILSAGNCYLFEVNEHFDHPSKLTSYQASCQLVGKIACSHDMKRASYLIIKAATAAR